MAIPEGMVPNPQRYRYRNRRAINEIPAEKELSGLPEGSKP
jgi:hypothetical protein